MRKIPYWIWIGAFIWIAGLVFASSITSVWGVEKEPYGEFKETVIVDEIRGRVGANITLQQEIHDEGAVTYRYKLKTDCPTWEYEDRYETTKRLEWVGEKSAVMAEAYRVTILQDGNVLANGQYFYVPLLKLQQDDMTYGRYKEQLLKQAYRQQEEQQDFLWGSMNMFSVVVGIFAVVVAFMVIWRITVDKRRRQKEADVKQPSLEQSADKVEMVLGVIEKFLEKRDIRIPDERRTGDPEESCLFGAAYEELEEQLRICLETEQKECL